jgi:hypothetical protein
MSRPRFAKRLHYLIIEEFEPRLVPTINVALNPTVDTYGDQIVTVQAYSGPLRNSFGIFDTGSSAVTFSAQDQAALAAEGRPIPVQSRGDAWAGGLGGQVVGNVAVPARFIGTGIHAATMTMDGGVPQFSMQLRAGISSVNPVQEFLGAAPSSSAVPTITGTPVMEPTPQNPSGAAALVRMRGENLDLSAEIPGLDVSIPDLWFVRPGYKLPGGPNLTTPIQVPLTLIGNDTYSSPGGGVTEGRLPVQFAIALQAGGNSISQQSFLFDTGAQVTVISSVAATALGLDLNHPVGLITVDGVGGSEKVPEFVLDELDVPGLNGQQLRFTNVPVAVLDLSDGLDGVLGMNLFNQAAAMLYDPNGPVGPSASFTFYQKSVPDGSDGNTLAQLEQLALPFAETVHGSDLPGYEFTPGTITGHVYDDLNGDGRFDAGDTGLWGQTVYADLSNSGYYLPGDPTAVTSFDGSYTLTYLPPGSFKIREIIPNNMMLETPATGFLHETVTYGTDVTGADFGNLSLLPYALSSPFSLGGYSPTLSKPAFTSIVITPTARQVPTTSAADTEATFALAQHQAASYFNQLGEMINGTGPLVSSGAASNLPLGAADAMHDSLAASMLA